MAIRLKHQLFSYQIATHVRESNRMRQMFDGDEEHKGNTVFSEPKHCRAFWEYE